MKKNADLIAKVDDLEQAVIDIEKERDFYFSKLRNVEVMLQVHQEQGAESDPDSTVEEDVIQGVVADELAGEDLLDSQVDDFGDAIYILSKRLATLGFYTGSL
jgi:hypothetical protein